MMRVVLVAIVVMVATCASARMQVVRAWRGETVTARLGDTIEVGGVPDGLAMRVGVLRRVDYMPKPNGVQLASCYDRVEWEGKGGGPRIVEVSVPADAKPGDYRSGMLTVTVVDRVLPPPREWKYFLDLWQHPWAVARMAGVKPFSPEHYAAMRPVYELLASAGQKAITVSILDEPWDHQCADAYHSLVDDPDFKTFDEYVTFCRDCGLGPYISCYSLCPWKLKEKPGTPEFEKRWGAFLDRFAAHLKAKGWFDQTLMAMDERAPDQVKAVADFVRRHAPGLRISMAGNRRPSDFKDVDIEVYSQALRLTEGKPALITPEFLAESAARRKRGFVTTHYVCCAPNRPNTFMDSPDGEAFWLGAYPAMCGLDGFLRWAWNSWPRDPCEDASFSWWRAGDTFLCYPGGAPSLRFLELRNGIIAAEKVRILREAGLFAPDLDAVAKLYDVDAALNGRCDFVKIRSLTLNAVNRAAVEEGVK